MADQTDAIGGARDRATLLLAVLACLLIGCGDDDGSAPDGGLSRAANTGRVEIVLRAPRGAEPSAYEVLLLPASAHTASAPVVHRFPAGGDLVLPSVATGAYSMEVRQVGSAMPLVESSSDGLSSRTYRRAMQVDEGHTTRIELAPQLSTTVRTRVRYAPSKNDPRPSLVTFLREAGEGWTALGFQPKARAEREAGDSYLWEFEQIPLGRYRLELTSAVHRAVVLPLTVESLAVPIGDFGTLEALDGEITLRYEGPFPDEGRGSVNFVAVRLVDGQVEAADARWGAFRESAREVHIARPPSGQYLLRLDANRVQVGTVVQLPPGDESVRLAPPAGWLTPVEVGPTREVVVEWKGRPVLRGEIAWVADTAGPALPPGVWFSTEMLVRSAKVRGLGPGRHRIVLFDHTAGSVVGLGAPYRDRIVEVSTTSDRVVVSLP